MKISVIVPVYNVSSYLEQCMETLLGQTFSDREIILVDDGSTDGSGELCDRYAKGPRVCVIHQENAGLGMARNTGLAVARGEYLAFVDSDDWVQPTLLEELYEAAAAADADLAVGGLTAVRKGGRREEQAYTQTRLLFSGSEIRGLTLNTVGSAPEERLDSRYGLSACGRLYRGELIRKHGLRFVSERELISEDLIFNLDFLRHTRRAVIIPGCGYQYRTNDGSLSKRHRSDRFRRDCELYRAVGQHLKEGGFAPEEYGLYLDRMLISRARFDMIQEVAWRDGVQRDYPLRQAVENIWKCSELQDALRSYPWQRLPKMHGVFAFAMKRGWTDILIWLIRGRRMLRP